jgi:predicted CXXCH cytochrome family protein
MAGAVTTMPTGPGRLGTDLSDDHPVSFAYTAALAAARGGELVSPATLTGRIKLDASGQMQCTACHDPHDDTNGKFLVVPNQASALCQACHVKAYWASSSHRLSTKTWNGVTPDPWPHTSETTVAANACENCHQPHSAAGKKWLLNTASEEGTCFNCHNGNVAAKNVNAEFLKSSRHDVAATTGTHDPAETAVVASRHVECTDCHNPHATKDTGAAPPGSLTGVRGITMAGVEINPVTSEEQVCFRCHADSTNKPAPRTPRVIAQTNTRLEFGTTNPSYHPVAGPGRNSNVPSLIAPLTTASTIKCTSCHNNNAGPGAAGTGPNGPHGSTFTPLLERQYVVADNTSESAANYALCYKCHSRTSILGDNSFRLHNKHIVGERTPCNVCHDPHGVSSTQGNAINNSKLINFDTSVVRAVSTSVAIRFESTGTNAGRCYLVCHGKQHNPESY